MVNLQTLFAVVTNRTALKELSIAEQIDVLRARRIMLKSSRLHEDVNSDIANLTDQRQQLVVKRNRQNELIDRQIRQLDQQIMQREQMLKQQGGQSQQQNNAQPTSPQATQQANQSAMQAQSQQAGPEMGNSKSLI